MFRTPLTQKSVIPFAFISKMTVRRSAFWRICLILAAGYALFLLRNWLVIFAIAMLIPYYIGLRFFNKSFGTKAYISEILPDGYNDELCN